MQMWDYTKETPEWRKLFPMSEEGIFTLIASQGHTFPDKLVEDFETESALTTTLDIMANQRFAHRLVSDPIMQFYDQEDWDDEEGAYKLVIAEQIWALYHKKWERLTEVMYLEYDPIHNFYDKLDETTTTAEDETTTDDIDKTYIKVETKDLVASRLNAKLGDKRNTGTEQNQRTDNLNERSGYTVGVSHQDSNSNNIYGFNSQTPVGADTSGGSSSDNTVQDFHKDNRGTQTNVRTDNLQETNTESEQGNENQTVSTNSSDTQTDDRTSVRDLDGTRERHMVRLGNIGNLTTQALINQEIELWRWNVINEMVNDVKEFGTLPIYC